MVVVVVVVVVVVEVVVVVVVVVGAGRLQVAIVDMSAIEAHKVQVALFNGSTHIGPHDGAPIPDMVEPKQLPHGDDRLAVSARIQYIPPDNPDEFVPHWPICVRFKSVKDEMSLPGFEH